MEQSLQRENTRIRSRLAALRCRGSEDAVLFGPPPGETSGALATVYLDSAPTNNSGGSKYLPPSQIASRSDNLALNDLRKSKAEPEGVETQMKDTPTVDGAKKLRPRQALLSSAGDNELTGAIQNLIGTILEDKEEKISRSSCYRALHRYATIQLEIRTVRAQLRTLRTQHDAAATQPASNAEKDASKEDGDLQNEKSEQQRQQIAKLGTFLKDLQVIHELQQKTFQEAIEAKDAQLYYQEEKLKAANLQAAKLTAQLQELQERSEEYEHEIRRLNASIELSASTPPESAVASRRISSMHDEEQDEKDVRIKELQAQLDALTSENLDTRAGNPTSVQQQASHSEVTLGDLCDILEPSSMIASPATKEPSTLHQDRLHKCSAESQKTSRDDQQGSSLSLELHADTPAEKASAIPSARYADCSNALTHSQPLQSILRQPKHSRPIESVPATQTTASEVDTGETEPTQEMAVGSTNVSLDLTTALESKISKTPPSSSPIVRSKVLSSAPAARLRVIEARQTDGECFDASLDFLPGASPAKAGSTEGQVDVVNDMQSKAIRARSPISPRAAFLPRSLAPRAPGRAEESILDFRFGSGDDPSKESAANSGSNVSKSSNAGSEISLQFGQEAGSIVSKVQSYASQETSLQDFALSDSPQTRNVTDASKGTLPRTPTSEVPAVQHSQSYHDTEQAVDYEPNCNQGGDNLEEEADDIASEVHSVPDNQRAYNSVEASLHDDLSVSDDKVIDEASSLSPLPDNQRGYDVSESSLEDDLFVTHEGANDDSLTAKEEKVEVSEEDSAVTPIPDNQIGYDASESSLQEDLFMIGCDVCDESDEANCEVASIATPAPDNQKGFNSSEPSLEDNPFATEGDASDENDEEASAKDENFAIEVSLTPSPVPDNQKGFDSSEPSLTDDLFITYDNGYDQEDDEVSGKDEIDDGKVVSTTGPSPDNQKGLNASETSLEEELFVPRNDASDEDNGDDTEKDKNDVEEASSTICSVPDNQNGFDSSESSLEEALFVGIDNPSVGDSQVDKDDDKGASDTVSTATPVPDNQRVFDSSEPSLEEQLVISQTNTSGSDSLASENDGDDAIVMVVQNDAIEERDSRGAECDDDFVSTGTPEPDNQKGYDFSEGSLEDLFENAELAIIEEDEEEGSSSEIASQKDLSDYSCPLTNYDHAVAQSNSKECSGTPHTENNSRRHLEDNVIVAERSRSHRPEPSELTVDEMITRVSDEAHEESSTIDSVTGASALHGSGIFSERCMHEALRTELRKVDEGVIEDAPLSCEPERSVRDAATIVTSPASRGERILPPQLKRQETVSSTFGVDSLRFLSLNGDESQRSVTRRSSYHSKLSADSSPSRSKPPLATSSGSEHRKEKQSKDSHANVAASAVEASPKESKETRQHVEDLTRLLEEERASSFNEYQTVQSELEETRAELEKCQGTVAALEKELADTEYNLVQVRQKVSMLETYVVEDLIPPEEVVEQCYASQGLEYRRTSSASQDEAEVELLKKEAADLRSQLTVANTLVIKLEEDRTKHLKKIADMARLLKTSKDSQKRLFEKSVECADLVSERDLLKQQLTGLKDKNAALEAKLSETLGELEELQFSEANESMRETLASVEHREEKERALKRIMETSIELAECKMNLDSVTEQLKMEQKRNQELTVSMQDLDRSSNRGIRNRVNMSLNLSNHSTSQRSSHHRLGLPTVIMSSSSDGNDADAIIRRLQRKVAELEQQNEAYLLQVSTLKAHNRMESVQE
jgi:hypothetical protein